MTSPSPLHIPPPHNANNLPLDAGTTDYSISRIFGMLIEPKHGRVSPGFIKYQDPEHIRMGQDGESMVQGATGEGLDQTQNAVHIPSTLDLTVICCASNDHLAPDTSTDYQHSNGEGQFHFVPPGHARQLVEEAV